MPIYEEPTIINKQYPTLAESVELVRRFNIQDDKGRDVRGLKSVLLRMATISPRLSGHILTRNTALYGFEWDIIPGSPAEKIQVEKVKARLDDIIDQFLSSHAQTALFDSMAVDLKFERNDIYDALVPKITKWYEPYELDILSDGSLAKVDDKNLKTPFVDNGSVFWDNLKPAERGGALRSIIFHEVLRNETMVDWSNLNKRMKGIVLGIIDPELLKRGATAIGMSNEQVAKQIEGLDLALKNAGENNYLKTLNAIDVKLASIVEGSAGASYSDFKKTLDADISISILGQANTTELPQNGGSRAAVQILNLIRTDILYADMIACSRRMKKLLLMDYRMNVNPNATSVPWKFKFLDNETVDFEANARIYETMSRIGVPVSKEEFYHKTGTHPPADAADTLELKQSNIPVF